MEILLEPTSNKLMAGPSEGSGIALEVFDEPHLKGSNEEAEVTPEVPNRPGNDSSSSSFEISVEDISSDDDEVPVNDADMSMQVEDATDTAVITTDSVAEVIENDNTVTLTFENVKMTNVEMVTDQQNPGESEVQSMVDVPVTQATPAVLRHPPIESIVTLSPDTTIIPSSLPPLTQPIQELLFRMMDKAKTLKRHPKHKALYDALVASLIVDEDDIDIVFGKSHPRNNHDKDHPPNADSKKKRRRDDTDNDPSTNKGILDIETNAKDIGHNSTPSALVTNKPNWFKESPRSETLDSPDPDWSKEPSATANFDDILGTTFEFLNFVKHRLQKDTLTKADLEGPINPEGNSTPKDFNNPLPLVGAPNRLYIQASHFFNKDLEYLRTRNLEEKKYSSSTTKTRAIRYESYGVKEMVKNL
ncbi:hypothetical protein Tco_0664789 [Tanacetum coccineum]